jgi:hypothetical protein
VKDRIFIVISGASILYVWVASKEGLTTVRVH